MQGYGANGKKSFVQVVEETTDQTAIHKVGVFPLKQNGKIIDFIGEYDPDMVLLQLGNYEYHASLKRILKKRKKGSGLGSSSSEASATPNTIPLTAPRKLHPLHRFIILPVIWIVLKRRTVLHLKLIKEYIKFYPDKKFVVLSPLVCLKETDNYIRQKGGQLMFRLFGGMANVTFINTHEILPADKRIFSDPFHLNAVGHKLLGEKVARRMLESFQSKIYLAAS